jgi:hypothetical protein
VNESLPDIAGNSAGVGVNHDQEEFTGRMTLLPHLGSSRAFTAVGANDEIYHDERTLVGFNAQGELAWCSPPTTREVCGITAWRTALAAAGSFNSEMWPIRQHFARPANSWCTRTATSRIGLPGVFPGGRFKSDLVVRMSRVPAQA